MMKQVKFRIPLRMMAVLFGLVLSIGAYAQITVNGHVKDATGEPIIGATVRVAGSEGEEALWRSEWHSDRGIKKTRL